MKKIICSITAFLSVVSVVSCGRTVKREGANFNDFPANSGFQIEISSEPVTEAVTDYQNATDGEEKYIEENVSVQIGAPEHIEIDPYMPDGYKLSDPCVIDGFETVMQNPELPTGCEITALAQTLNFYGFDIDKVDLCDMFMPIDINGYYTMNDVYLGDPRSNNGFGCNAPVITMAASYYFTWIGSDWYSIDLTGMSLREVFIKLNRADLLLYGRLSISVRHMKNFSLHWDAVKIFILILISIVSQCTDMTITAELFMLPIPWQEMCSMIWKDLNASTQLWEIRQLYCAETKNRQV